MLADGIKGFTDSEIKRETQTFRSLRQKTEKSLFIRKSIGSSQIESLKGGKYDLRGTCIKSHCSSARGVKLWISIQITNRYELLPTELSTHGCVLSVGQFYLTFYHLIRHCFTVSGTILC